MHRLRSTTCFRFVLPSAATAFLTLFVACGGGETTAQGSEAGTPSTGNAAATAPAAEDSEAAPANADASGDCPSSDLAVRIVNSYGNTILEVDPLEVAGGHAILDLDGDGWGPLLNGALTSDPSADPETVAANWADPDAPPEGRYHLTFFLKGQPEGATEYPVGTYDWVPEDGAGTNPEMSLGGLTLHTPEGSERPLNRDTSLVITHSGGGKLCGRFEPVTTEAPQGGTAQYAEGAFVATLAEQP